MSEADAAEAGDESVEQQAAGEARARQGASREPDGVFENVGAVSAAVAVGVGAAIIESELIPGILIGAGAVLLGKLFPQVVGTLRPVVKTVIRAGLVVTDKAREAVAEAGEQVQDMVAEVQAERAEVATERPRRRRAAAKEATGRRRAGARTAAAAAA